MSKLTLVQCILYALAMLLIVLFFFINNKAVGITGYVLLTVASLLFVAQAVARRIKKK